MPKPLRLLLTILMLAKVSLTVLPLAPITLSDPPGRELFLIFCNQRVRTTLPTRFRYAVL